MAETHSRVSEGTFLISALNCNVRVGASTDVLQRVARGLSYTSSFLRRLRKQPLDPSTAKKCKEAGILRFRGCRGGRNQREKENKKREGRRHETPTNGEQNAECGNAILLLNARSIVNKGPLLAALVTGERPSVIAITETWLRKDIPDDVIHAGDFKLYRTDRERKKGGGVALLFQSDWQTCNLKCHEGHPETVECCIVRARKHFMPRETPNIVFYVIYVPPGLTVDQQKQVQEHIALTNDKYMHLCPGAKSVIMGDFNNTNVYYACSSLGLQQVVRRPTRGDKILDQIWTNLKTSVTVNLPPLGDSDHQVVKTTISHEERIKDTPRTKTIITRQINELAINRCGEFLAGTDWSFVLRESNLDRKTKVLSTFLIDTYDNYFPETQRTIYPTSKPWISKKTLQLMCKRRLAFKHKDHQRYKELNAQVKAQILQDKSNYYNNNVRQLKGSNPRRWYHQTKALAGSQARSVRSRGEECKLNLNDLNDFFANMGKGPGEIVPPICPHFKEVSQIDQLESYETFRLLSKVDTSKSQPFGDVPSFLLKKFSGELAQPITDIYNESLKTAQIPELWTTAEILPIPKTKSPKTMGEWRPIVKISALLKVLEKFVAGILRVTIISSIVPNQYGGLPKTSTAYYLISLLHLVHLNVNKGKYVCVVTLDVAKAFNSVDLQLLIDWLKECNLSPQLYNWIVSFLINMAQIVRPSGAILPSRPVKVDKGILQGTSLAPTLSLAYVNNVPSIPELWSFLDDLTVAGIGNSAQDALNDAQMKLNTLEAWYSERKLSLNASKCKALMVGNRQVPTSRMTPLKIGGKLVPFVSEVKILGVTMQNSLKWTLHVDNVISKGNYQLFCLRQLTTLEIDRESLLQMYKTYTLTQLDYASAAWAPALTKSQMARLERIQRRACYMISRLWHTPYEELLTILDLTALQYRRDELNTRVAKRMIEDARYRHLFPPTQGQSSGVNTRNANKLARVNLKTERFRKSPIPYLCRLLNDDLSQNGGQARV